MEFNIRQYNDIVGHTKEKSLWTIIRDKLRSLESWTRKTLLEIELIVEGNFKGEII